MLIPDLNYLSDALPDADAIFEELRATIHWETSIRARKTASYGLPYNYSGLVYPFLIMPPRIAEIGARVERVLGHKLTNCLANGYEDGRSAMGFHADSYVDLEPTSTIAIVSLGAPRSLVFRRIGQAKPDAGPHTTALEDPIELRLAHGSLVTMGPSIQESYRHAIPKEPSAGERISLTYRWVLPALGPSWNGFPQQGF